MARQTGTRKCDYCKELISVKNKNKLDNVLRHKNKFYHKECFVELAESRVAAQNRYSVSWQEALDNIDQLVEDAKISITTRVKTDPLNDYLLLYYDVASLSSKFWSTINDIGNGIYKHKRCKPIDCNTLLDMWKLYQKELNQIYVWNKSKGNDMIGEGRVVYDLAILMHKYGEYTKVKAKQEAAIIDAKRNASIVNDEVDMSKVGRKQIEKKESISDIFNDFYIE